MATPAMIKGVGGLIIMMVLLAACARQVESRVALPLAPHAPEIRDRDRHALHVEVAQNGTITLGRKIVTVAGLRHELELCYRKKDYPKIILRADRSTSMLHILPVIETSQNISGACYFHPRLRLAVLRQSPDLESELDFIVMPKCCDMAPFISLSREHGVLTWNRLIMDPDELRRNLVRMAAGAQDQFLNIVPATTNSVQDLVNLMDTCYEAGVTNLAVGKSRVRTQPVDFTKVERPPNSQIVSATPESSQQVLAQLTAEVIALEARCVPSNGTPIAAVSARYGPGVRVTDPMFRMAAPPSSESRCWVFHPLPDSEMLVFSDEGQKVISAGYTYGVQNRAQPPPLDEEIREKRGNLEFLKGIFVALEAKGIAAKPNR